jgi:hypothetical protein
MYSNISTYTGMYSFPDSILAQTNLDESAIEETYNRSSVSSNVLTSQSKVPNSVHNNIVHTFANKAEHFSGNAKSNSQVNSQPNSQVKTALPPSSLESLGNTSDPKIWGPPFWFSLHVSAAHYPIQPSSIVRERMKCRILAIPYEIPCATCRPHASAYIEKYRSELDNIVATRHNLGQFYVDFHNQVNKRYGKPEWTYEQAYRYYGGN